MKQIYNLDSDRVFVMGFKDLKSIDNIDKVSIFKKITYPSVLKDIYLINQYGIVVNELSKTIITNPWINEKGFPCFLLSCKDEDNHIVRNNFRIVDLVAYSFIENSELFIERGYIASNKNKIKSDNYYANIEYVKQK